jgi:hypothetical protein
MRRLCVLAVLFCWSASAAEPRRVAVDTPVEAFTAHPAAEPALVLFVNRCSGTCAITGGAMNDARSHLTSIPAPGSYIVEEYKNAAGLTGTAADAEWNAVLDCLKDVYSPYNVVVTDVKPADGVAYNEAIVAGMPQNVGLGTDILGIAPLANDCSAQSNVMSFSFANYHSATERVNNICWTAAQESGHAYGLDHQYVFEDGESACSDPTTYRMDCGGRKFFRNRFAKCGEDKIRKCRCSTSQNSHQKLLTVFGAGTVTTAPPTATLTFPTNGITVAAGWSARVEAGSERGVNKVELYLNGSRWAVQPGVKFGSRGQLNPASYTLMVPATVPDGVMDVYARALDDLGAETSTATVTVTKGSPCTSAASCLDKQTCDAGRCMYPAPAGELGDECSYDQYCKSWSCIEATSGDKRCVSECRTNETASCPVNFMCLPTGDTEAGVCWPTDTGGCCSAGRDGSQAFAFSAVLLVMLRRKRKSVVCSRR